MFDSNFTFSRSPSWTSSNGSTSTREPSRSVSPCSPLSAFPLPQERYSVTDLAADLDRQRIRPEARVRYQPCDSYANTTDDDAAWDIPPLSTGASDSEEGDSTYSGSISAAPTTATRSYSPSSRRAARQATTRLLCASQHHAKDIAALVSRMVSSSDQCSVVPPPDSLPRPIPSDEEADDEGYTSSYTAEDSFTSSSRRATISKRNECRRAFNSRRSAGAAAIAKDIRFRSAKDHRGHRRHRSSGDKVSAE